MSRVVGGGPGEKAGRIARRLLPDTEVIGPPECPLLHRWTLAEVGRRRAVGDTRHGVGRSFKVLLHHFLPNADDRAVHDHSRPFWTFVLRGGYDDLVPCPACGGTRLVDDPELVALLDAQPGLGLTSGTCWMPCRACEDPVRGPLGIVLGERMRAGMLRHRPAEHRHRTRVHEGGCWTIVIMGPRQRRWGFWKDGRWYFWRDFEERWMRCDDE